MALILTKILEISPDNFRTVTKISNFRLAFDREVCVSTKILKIMIKLLNISAKLSNIWIKISEI